MRNNDLVNLLGEFAAPPDPESVCELIDRNFVDLQQALASASTMTERGALDAKASYKAITKLINRYSFGYRLMDPLGSYSSAVGRDTRGPTAQCLLWTESIKQLASASQVCLQHWISESDFMFGKLMC